MTAADNPALVAAAAAAVTAGMEQANQYHASAAANPGIGMKVRLPSVPGTVGLSFDTPPEPAPMPGRPAIKLTPNYASDVVGGALHHGSPSVPTARSDDWPPNTTIAVLPRSSSVQFVPASTPAESVVSRVIGAIRRMLGRQVVGPVSTPFPGSRPGRAAL
jgi:hypothetical protein